MGLIRHLLLIQAITLDVHTKNLMLNHLVELCANMDRAYQLEYVNALS